MKRTTGILIAACTAALLVTEAASAADRLAERNFKEGAAVYQEHCAGCHGAGGDGKGFERILESIRPPDFTAGEIRYKSTAAGTPPTDADLERSIANGVPRTSMPHHNFFEEGERLAVVAYVSSFLPDWAGDPPQPVVLPPRPKYLGSDASLRRGRELYGEFGCPVCHGDAGDGRGEAATSLSADSRGLRQRPVDLRTGTFKGGGTLGDVFRTLVTGLDGTSMAPRAQQLLGPDGDGWHLVHYVATLGQKQAPR